MSVVEGQQRQQPSYQQQADIATSPQNAFATVADGIEHWWSDMVAGGCAKGQSVAVVFGKTAKLLKTVEREEASRLVWECRDVLMPDPEAHYPQEWIGTRMIWEFEASDKGVLVTLTHDGLTGELACYETCEKAWNFFFLDSLKSFLETGKGEPHLNKG